MSHIKIDNFDWKYYISKYDDLKTIKNENDAYKHYMLHGKSEGRIASNKSIKFVFNNKFENITLKLYNVNVKKFNKLFNINGEIYYI